MEKPIKWKPEEIEFLKDNHSSMDLKQLSDTLGFSQSRTLRMIYRLKLRATPHKHYTKQEVQAIEKYFATHSFKEIGEMIGRSSESVKHKFQSLGMKRTKEQARAVQRKCCSGTQFHKGHKPGNTKFDGKITVRHAHKDRGNRAYKYIRLSEAEWVPLHTYLWKKHYGEVPEGSIIVFKDKNTMNCNIENLECITMSENMKRNSGIINLQDNYVAHLIAGKQKHLKEEILKQPELIQAKREIIKLNKIIRDHEQQNSDN